MTSGRPGYFRRFGKIDPFEKSGRRAGIVAAAGFNRNRAETAVDPGEFAAGIEHGLLALDEAHQRFLAKKGSNAGAAAGADHGLKKLCLADERLIKRRFGLVQIARDPQLRHTERHVLGSLGGKTCHRCLSVSGAPPGARYLFTYAERFVPVSVRDDLRQLCKHRETAHDDQDQEHGEDRNGSEPDIGAIGPVEHLREDMMVGFGQCLTVLEHGF